MTSAFERLVHLVHVKNELNRKRRRFYRVMQLHFNPTKTVSRIDDKGFMEYRRVEIKKPTHINKHQAAKGYLNACEEMRAMTKEIKQLMKQTDSFLRWDANWRVKEIVTRGVQRVYAKDFEHFANSYVAESYLLSEGTGSTYILNY